MARPSGAFAMLDLASSSAAVNVLTGHASDPADARDAAST